jgi:glucose-6-phosphate isomerase
MAMELPDEAVSFSFQGLLAPTGEDWSPAAEMRARHFVSPARLKDLAPRLAQCRSQVAADREVRNPPPEAGPLHPDFIDLPQKLLDDLRRKSDNSEVGKILALAGRLKDDADRVVVLGVGGSQLAARALFDALKPAYHNELPPESRLGVPRLYFAGDGFDNDALQELLDLIQITCVDPDNREERWAVVCVSKSGATLEPAVALRVFRREAAEYYGLRSPWLKQLFAAVTGPTGKLRELFKARQEEEPPTIPDNVGGRFSAFTAAGLLPAALLGLDVRALLLGAAAMSRRFLEEPFERNPVLQLAAVSHMLSEEQGKPLRVLQCWSRRLEGLARWYEHLLAESLGKQGRGPTPLTLVATRDLHSHGQQQLEGPRDRVVFNFGVRAGKSVPIMVGMADHNQDDLNQHNRKGLPDLAAAAQRAAAQAAFDGARPTADLTLPALSEHALGQAMQLLMLATVVEGRLMGLNPYGQPALDAYKRNLTAQLRAAAGRPGSSGNVSAKDE